MMTVEDLGRRTKAKYSEYGSMSDAEVGQKVIEKYPEYQSQIKQPSVLEKIMGFLTPASTNIANDVGRAVGIGNTPGLEESQNEARAMQQQVFERAQRETDPAKKAELMKFLQGSGENLSNSITPLTEGYSEDVNKSNFNRATAASGEIGALLMPGNKLLKSGNGLTRVAGGGLQGLGVGSLLGLTDIDAENAGDRITGGITGGTIGAVTGGVTQGLFEVGKAGIKKLVGNAPDKIRKIIRPNPSELDKFKQNTGWDYAEELVKRDAKNIEGMDYPQLESYFKNKYQQAVGKVDDELANANKSVSKIWLKKQFDEVLDIYKDRPAVAEKVKTQFETYYSYLDNASSLKKHPYQVPVSIANEIKRDLQELASSAYGNTSNSVPKAYQKLAARLNKEITRVYPRAAELNKETQLYRLISKAVSRTSSREGNKISTSFMDKLLQTIPASAGVGVGLMTGNPLAGIGTSLMGAGASKAREVARSPQVQTTLASKIQQGVDPKIQALLRALEGTTRKGASVFSAR